MDAESEKRRRYTRCSFCGKSPDQVRKLVAGPGVYICDQCIQLCNEVLEEDRKAGPPLHNAGGQVWKSTAARKGPGLWDRLRHRLWHLAPAYR
jgi:hypothetical protein